MTIETRDAGEIMRQRLQMDLRTALKGRQMLDAAVLRRLIAAIDNAGAVPLPPQAQSMQTEVERRRLSSEDVQELLRREYEGCRQAADQFGLLGRTIEREGASLEMKIVSRYFLPPSPATPPSAGKETASA